MWKILTGCWRPSRYIAGAWKYSLNFAGSIVADIMRSFKGGRFFNFLIFCARLATPNRTSVCTDRSWASSSITTCTQIYQIDQIGSKRNSSLNWKNLLRCVISVPSNPTGSHRSLLPAPSSRLSDTWSSFLERCNPRSGRSSPPIFPLSPLAPGRLCVLCLPLLSCVVVWYRCIQTCQLYQPGVTAAGSALSYRCQSRRLWSGYYIAVFPPAI